MTDPIVDEVRRIREELIKHYGGLGGYLKHCEEQDRRRTSEGSIKARRKPQRRTTRSRKGSPKP